MVYTWIPVFNIWWRKVSLAIVHNHYGTSCHIVTYQGNKHWLLSSPVKHALDFHKHTFWWRIITCFQVYRLVITMCLQRWRYQAIIYLSMLLHLPLPVSNGSFFPPVPLSHTFYPIGQAVWNKLILALTLVYRWYPPPQVCAGLYLFEKKLCKKSRSVNSHSAHF